MSLFWILIDVVFLVYFVDCIGGLQKFSPDVPSHTDNIKSKPARTAVKKEKESMKGELGRSKSDDYFVSSWLKFMVYGTVCFLFDSLLMFTVVQFLFADILPVCCSKTGAEQLSRNNFALTRCTSE